MAKTQEYLIDSADLITLPDIYIRIKNAIEDKETDLNEITQLLEHDPAISTRLLQLANSPIYGQIAKVDTIKKAVALLGTRKLHDLVLTISVSHSFQSIAGVNYDVAGFWKNSISRAALAKSCATQLQLEDTDKAFVTGLLSDIGHMIMSIKSPKLMHNVLIQHRKTGFALHLFERSTFGFDFGELGADILESWSIPASIHDPIRHQNCPEIGSNHQKQAAILYCAARMQANESEFPTIIDIETLKQAGIPEFDYEEARCHAAEIIEHAISLFPPVSLKKAV